MAARGGDKGMIVSMWMTRNVATIEPHTPIAEAAALMARKHVRRLPVVEHRAAGSHLSGIVSAKDIFHAFPPDVNPFAIAAPEAVRKSVTAAHIMSRHLVTTTAETPIEQAAALMTEKKIGALPVVRDERLVGLITESDIFRAFVSFFAPPARGARVTFDISQGEDVFAWLGSKSQQRKVRVKSLISSQQDNLPVCVVHVSGPEVEGLLEDIWNSGHRVLNVIHFS
jgi:acetoin utilization protein AcuB